MNNKLKIIEDIVKEENSFSLITIKDKINKKDEKLISKDLAFGLKAFLDDFFNNHFKNENEKRIDFNKITIFGNEFFNNIFSTFATKKSEINKLDIIDLCNKSNYILTEYEPLHDMDNVYGSLKNDVLYAVKQKDELFDKDIEPRYKSTMNIYNFGRYRIHVASTDSCNLPFISGVCWFSNELKDYRVNLHYSFEYEVLHAYLKMFQEVFQILSNISENLAQVVFYSNHDGRISIHFNKVNDQHFVYELEAQDIEELHRILNNTDQNTFINFLAQNNLFFSYKNNFLSCSKMGNKKLFSIDDVHIHNFGPVFVNNIMANINYNLNLMDIAYYGMKTKLLLSSQEEINDAFIKNLPIEKVKLFIAIFANIKNVDYSNYSIDDNDIAKLYGITKNNLIETYKRKKTEQYDVLRLGTTCKAYGFKEEDLLEVIKNYKLKRVDISEEN